MAEFNAGRICVTCERAGYWWNDCPHCSNMKALTDFAARLGGLGPDEQKAAIERALPPGFTVVKLPRDPDGVG